MLHVCPIASLDDPLLAPYLTMRQQQAHRRQQIFVAEGEKLVRRLLESRFTVVSVLLPQRWLQELTSLLEARPEAITAYVAEKRLLEQLTGFSMYQGLLAVGRVPALATLDQVLAASAPPRLLVAVDGLSSAENLGTVVRNCGAFGVQGLIVGESSCSPYLRRAVRASMGAIFHLPVVEVRNLAEALSAARHAGVRCVAAHPHVEGRVLSHGDFRGDCCLVFGSEGYGLSPAVLAACDEALAVPMPPAVDSMNVGSASAVFLYEVNRQRGRT